MPLLTDLQALLRSLEADLLDRSDSDAILEVRQTLHSEYRKAQDAERTAQSYETWRADYITQVAAAWVLSCVFARFLEDNRLIDSPIISGPGEHLTHARDEHELYFRAHPTETDREYLLHTFRRLSALPGASDIFGQHNPVHELPNWLSGDAAGELLRFFQRIDPETGALVHDFTDPDWDTRFLGDLYQDLSEAARKKYALLQTPEFVEEFILDRTLEPALEEFGLQDFRMIDPACGSGHFLLGSFARLLDRWQRREPGTNVRVLAQRALDSVCGVDVNPYAAAIARFRLLLAAMKEAGIKRMADAPAFRIHVACGDSLIHGVPGGDQLGMGWHALDHVYQNEDREELYRILKPGHYHAVVANPPYITVKDKALNNAYRERYSSCHRQYSLSVPFMQRIFSLAVSGGFTGQITANSFMKREFGKKLIEEFLPTIDLTHVIDASGAYIPGHGTPTVILFGRHRAPIGSEVRAVLGIRGEPSTPDDPALGQVWQSIISHLDRAGSQNNFVSITDIQKATFAKHPWTMGGGGAATLKQIIEEPCLGRLGQSVKSIGRTSVVGEDDCWILDPNAAHRLKTADYCLSFGIGERFRDWSSPELPLVIYPYTEIGGKHINADSYLVTRYLWVFRSLLKKRTVFGKSLDDQGRPWFEHLEHYVSKLRTPLSIAFAFVATHNHFVLDHGGKVFNRSAPIIKLPSAATEADHLVLLGLLNSSTACFWMKQVFHNKGATSDTGVLQADPEKFRFEFDGTKLRQFPIPALSDEQRGHLIALSSALDSHGRELSGFQFDKRISDILQQRGDLQDSLQGAIQKRDAIRSEMVRLQEELDWLCYEIFGLVSSDSLARSRIWAQLPEDMLSLNTEARPYRHKSGSSLDVWDAIDHERWRLSATDKNLSLVESPEYKRRWFRSAGAYDDTNLDDSTIMRRSIARWLLDRLESYFDFDGRMNDKGESTAKFDDTLASLNQLADVARQDADFMRVAELYRDDPAFDVLKLVGDLVESESVPLLPVLRYKASGLRKRTEWERTWELQRQEDQLASKQEEMKEEGPLGDSATLTEIPVPPKYTGGDFATTTYWRLRGKLDVPKERWVSFPHCEGADGTLMIAWAGYDHLQLARAISAHYVDVQDRLGGRDDPRLLPLLGCLIELLPWLKQWHNEVNPEFGMRMGDYFDNFVQEQARQMSKTLDEIKAWQAPKKTRRSKRKKQP